MPSAWKWPAGRGAMIGLNLRPMPHRVARGSVLSAESGHTLARSKSFQLRGVDTERRCVCHALCSEEPGPQAKMVVYAAGSMVTL